MKKLLTIIGTRPQFIKASVLSNQLQKKKNPFQEVLVHTGQHYDANLSNFFFNDLKITPPQYHLQISETYPAKYFAKVIIELNFILKKEQPLAILVYGDTTSTLAGAISSMYQQIPLIHIEAGERTYDRKNSPEEKIRMITDQLSTLCLTSTYKACEQLIQEGKNRHQIQFTGDLMYDLFLKSQEKIKYLSPKILQQFHLDPEGFYLATIHRHENTYDDHQTCILMDILDQCDLPVILPAHPRLEKILLKKSWKPKKQLQIIQPLRYQEILALLFSCKKCITDSGGLVKEAYFAQKQSIVPLNKIAWQDIVKTGWAIEIGQHYSKIIDALRTPVPKDWKVTQFGDGNSVKKIISAINLVF